MVDILTTSPIRDGHRTDGLQQSGRKVRKASVIAFCYLNGKLLLRRIEIYLLLEQVRNHLAITHLLTYVTAF